MPRVEYVKEAVLLRDGAFVGCIKAAVGEARPRHVAISVLDDAARGRRAALVYDNGVCGEALEHG